jgi:hypothetical protein
MPTTERDYLRTMAALSDLTRRRDQQLEDAERAYRESAARAAGELSRAESDASAADHRVGTTAAQVLAVDSEAARLWDRLRRGRGIRIRGLGELPDPAEHPVASGQEPARELLARAAGRIEDTVRPASRRPMPGWALALLPLLGALAAAAGGLVGAGLVTFGGTPVPGGDVIRAFGWLTFLVAPSAGAPLAAALAHRCLQARLDVGGIGLTLLGGMIAAALLALVFASAH